HDSAHGRALRIPGHVGDRGSVEAHSPVLPWDGGGDAAGAPARHAPLAALARPRDVLGPEDPTGAVADPERTGRLGVSPRPRQTHRSRQGAHASSAKSSARSTSGGPPPPPPPTPRSGPRAPGLCSIPGSEPRARSTNRGYCSRKTTGTSPVGPLRCLAMIRSASLGSASSSYLEAR